MFTESIILKRHFLHPHSHPTEMRNSFNLLLVSLACFDSTYLLGAIMESFRKNFSLASSVHIVLFPHLLYPLNQMAITASIFMTVSIAWERYDRWCQPYSATAGPCFSSRYTAVHHPLDYRGTTKLASAILILKFCIEGISPVKPIKLTILTIPTECK